MSESDEVIEIVPMDEYDSQKAKLQASLAWLLEKAYRNEVPGEFKEPFYVTAEGFLHVKPRLANLMVTSELYCQACRNMFGDIHSQWQGHWSIIQVLSRKGIHVVEPDDTEVTETVLMKNAPFQQNAHIALIDCIMMAYIGELLSVEKVVQAVRRFAVFSASSETPTDTEEAVKFWINKVCSTVQSREQKGSQVLEGESKIKVRIVSRSGDSSLEVPYIEDFLQDIGDGCCLAILLHFYCPDKLKLQDICIKSNVGIADSLYNLNQVRKFCLECLPWNIFHLSFEDFLYTHNNLKPNLYALMADLFNWFEINRAPGVTVQSKDEIGSRPATAKHLTSNKIPDVHISNVTKQSFRKSSMDDSGLHSPHGTGHPPAHKPLLPRRQMRSEEREYPPVTQTRKTERRSLSLSSAKERDVIQETMMAWQDKKPQSSHQEPTTSSASSNLLANVSIDTEMMESFTDDLIGSMDIGEDSNPTPPPTLMHPDQRENTHSNLHNRDHPDYIEVQSVTSRMTDHSTIEEGHVQNGEVGSRSASRQMEPLLPARIKPAKEKVNSHSKDQELSHASERKSPTKRDVEGISRGMSRSPAHSKGKSTDSAGSISLSEDSSITDSVTPLPDEMLSDTETSQRANYAAFSISGGNLRDRPVDKSSDSVKLSYTIQENVYTPEAARAAGIPVVSDSSDKQSFSPSGVRRSESHEGSVCSRSSGDFSDHESHKIHKDHKIKEAEDVKVPDSLPLKKPEMLIIKTEDSVIKPKSEKQVRTTNFAEIHKLKQGLGKIDNSGLVYMQHGQETNGEAKKSALRNGNNGTNKSEKKTTFAPMASRMTWQQTMQGSSSSSQAEGSEEQPVPSDLLQIRLKLEEKRKMIEKKKQRNEAQQQRLRQKLGKTAFLHVLKKPGEPENGVLEEEARSSSSGSFEDVSGGLRQEAERPMRKEHSSSPSRHDEYDSAGMATSQRPFSREGIQQTIENVRKKWFKEDGEVITQSYAEKPETPDSPPPVQPYNEPPAVPQPLKEYNKSLDNFDKNLSDLQSEINRLSLQQEQIKQSRGIPPRSVPPSRSSQEQQRHQTLPNAHAPSTPQYQANQGHKTSTAPQYQRTPTVSTTPQYQESRGPEISYNPQNMQPQQTPVGPVIASQHQYVPVTCGHGQYMPPVCTGQYAPPYNGYQQVYSPQGYPYPPQQMSPPYPIAGHGPLTSSPLTQGVVPAFSPMGPGIQQNVPPSSHIGAQMYQQTTTNYQQATPAMQQNVHSTEGSVPTSYNTHTPLSGHSVDQPERSNQVGSVSSVSRTIAQTNSVITNSSSTVDHTVGDGASKNEFFISFNESTPKPKPELGKNRHKSAPESQQQVLTNPGQSTLDLSSQNVSNESQNVSGQNVSGIGFVIGQDESSIDQDDEIQKKKDKFIALQQKRKEEQEKKKQYKDIEMSRRKEQERLKQEQAEQRKNEEKLRREQIFRQYQEKKQRDEEEPRPAVVKRERSLRQKSRPQSMYVRANKGNGDAMHKSTEDISPNGAGRRLPPRSNTFHHGKMRKAVSCNTLTSSGEGKSLAFGGMTHRTRPPSPGDLHGRGKMSASGSSETGSMSGSGSDYAGPKLYVKPSSKSNKTIIHNAISHVCLAGSVNTTMKNKVLEVLEGTEGHHFMILFRDHSCQYRSLYMYYPDTDFMIKVHGVGPGRITNSMVEKFYKYNSGGKKFSEVSSTKHLSVSIDAVVIHNSLWKSNKLATKNK